MNTSRRRIPVCSMLLAGVVGAILIGSGSSPWAVTPSLWEVQTQKQFEKGEPRGVSISSEGAVSLAPPLQPLADTQELYVWALAEDRQGTLYVGTGGDGKIFKVNEGGACTLLSDTPEVDILSLAIDRRGNVYAGSGPKGRIYKLAPSGSSSVFFESEEKYIWALSFDKAGNLYAGTGDAGKIYRIAPDGSGKVVFDAPETHIMCMARGADGTLYAGGEGEGTIYKLSPEDEVFALYDAAEVEIHSLTLDAQGNLYVGATSGVVPRPKGPTVQMLAPEAAKADEAQPPAPTVPRTRAGSTVYRIAPDGVVSDIWSSKDAVVLALAFDAKGNLVVGTGNKGYLYEITPQEESAMLARSTESQVTAILVDRKGRMVLGCANVGKLYTLGTGYASEGTLASAPRDAGTWSKWGMISWEAELPKGTKMSLFTRSGNTEKPGNTWSSWSEVPSGQGAAHMASPIARFLQWRVRLTTSKPTVTPILRRVSVVYLPRNLSPKIASISVQKGGGRKSPKQPSKASSSKGTSKSGGKPLKGVWKISWGVEDRNKDKLVYAVYFRGVGEKTWKLLKEDLRDSSYTWDSESFPDGRYVVKVVASDEPSNPSYLALSGEKVGEPFLVDNTPPAVKDLKAVPTSEGGYRVTGVAEDRTSPMTEGHYSVDGEAWKMLFPSDEIFDSRKEPFSFIVKPRPGEEHTLVVRVQDRAGNMGAGKVTIRKK